MRVWLFFRNWSEVIMESEPTLCLRDYQDFVGEFIYPGLAVLTMKLLMTRMEFGAAVKVSAGEKDGSLTADINIL